MSIEKHIRNKRFKVKDSANIKLVVETNQAEQITLEVIDLSVSGLSVKLIDGSGQKFSEDDIIGASKLILPDNQELTLARLAVRRIDKSKPEETIIGFSTIDMRVPLDGLLSRYLDQDFSSHNSSFDFELDPEKFTVANFVNTDFSNVDLFDRMRKFEIFFNEWKKADKFAYLIPRTGSQGSRVNLAKKRRGNRFDYLMMGSNDYLGLASRQELKDAAFAAMNKYGFGATGTPVTSGHSDLHIELCEKLSEMYGKDAAMLFTSGYAANVGIISGVARENDLLVADLLSHASMQDGMSMSRATQKFFKHNDMDHLEKILIEHRASHSGALILTEGVFSMDGTIGDLEGVNRLAKKYNCRVFIDQGHCLGVLGKHGLGAVEHFDLIDETDITMGLLSKALGSVGGFVVGSRELIDWLTVFSRSYMFATSLPPSNIAATLKAIEILESESLHLKLKKNVQHFVNSMNDLGANIDPDHCTPICPIVIANESKMGKMYQSLLQDGIFVLPVVFPVVSKNRSRFRISLRADLGTTEIDYLVSCFEKAMKIADFSFDQVDQELNPLAPKVRSNNGATPIRLKKAA